MSSCISDRPQCFEKNENCLHALCTTYVDKTLKARTEEYSGECK